MVEISHIFPASAGPCKYSQDLITNAVLIGMEHRSVSPLPYLKLLATMPKSIVAMWMKRVRCSMGMIYLMNVISGWRRTPKLAFNI